MNEKPTYKEIITELKTIEKQLNNPRTPIEEMVKLYKRSRALIHLSEELIQHDEEIIKTFMSS